MEDSFGGDLHLLADDPHGLHLRVHARPCRTGLQGILLRRSEPQTPRSGGKGKQYVIQIWKQVQKYPNHYQDLH